MSLNIGRSGTLRPSLATQDVQRPQWKDVSVVDQLNPEGSTPESYRNGVYNCAGAVAATVARSLGTKQGQTDADLINDLSRDRTTSKGTSTKGMVSMLQEVGAKVDGKVITGRYSDNRLDSLLAKGDKVVAQVGVKNESTGRYDPHYVIVDGKDKKGNYVIKDPMKGTYSMSGDALRKAVNHMPGAGGVLIPIKPAEPRAVAPQEAASPGGLGTAKVSGPTVDTIKTDDSKVQGKDTTFKPYLTDSYQDHQPKQPVTLNPQETQELFKPVVPTVAEAPQVVAPDMGADQYANHVLDLLHQNGEDTSVKEQGQQLLDQLETSANPVDQKAYEKVMNNFADQSAIGQRVKVRSYEE
ncbi:hypothetical protein JRI60_39030 [Archangium violaceum]|uniref:hypothetical protein n=1 Tax=Archangium violaceum TaxID=83451 RepID=UPI00194F5491|nr:hypothetical protein [Archangium violaceum]QRN95037.1 hypothetical protein JRI60_39030 [Archangium violaceum]